MRMWCNALAAANPRFLTFLQKKESSAVIGHPMLGLVVHERRAHFKMSRGWSLDLRFPIDL